MDTITSLHTRPSTTLPGRPLPIRKRTVVAAAALLSLAGVACGSAAGADGPPGSDDDGPPRVVSVDWDDMTIEPTHLADGWTLSACVDGATVICVTDDQDRPVGTIELGSWTAGDVGPVAPWLRGQVDEFLVSFREDRKQSCGDGYTFALDGTVTDVVVDGAPGVTYRYTGTDADGVRRELGLTTLVLRDGVSFWISAVSYDADSCVPRGEGEFTPTVLGAFAPWYDAIIAGSSLPARADDAGEDEADGDVEGRISFQDDLLVVRHVRVLSGEEARQAAIADGVIGADEDLPNDVYIEERSSQSAYDVSDDVQVQIYDCTSGCELKSVSFEDLRDGVVDPYNGESAIFAITLVGDVVTAMVEIYLP